MANSPSQQTRSRFGGYEIVLEMHKLICFCNWRECITDGHNHIKIPQKACLDQPLSTYSCVAQIFLLGVSLTLSYLNQGRMLL